AFEEGLAATREALRRLARDEAALTAQLNADRARLSRLLGALQAIEAAPPPLLMMHPDGPLGAARSGIALADLAPALAAETRALRAQVTQLERLRAVQHDAAADLATALDGMQTARAALSRAMADRTDLPPNVAADADALQRLLAASASLDAAVAALADQPLGPAPEDGRFAAAIGSLEMPVRGRILLGFNDVDAQGISRPGLRVATEAGALVTAPWAGTVRFAGTLPDLGTVVLLEPDQTHLIVLSGLGTVFARPGDLVAAGAPIGLMGDADREDLIAAAAQETGGTLSETLYIEIRVDNMPADPVAWFRTIRDED
ncbi:MAG: peptidoglycan DD-metalloendopeptidase family protein, partial [Pseudomonadota bacterium]